MMNKEYPRQEMSDTLFLGSGINNTEGVSMNYGLDGKMFRLSATENASETKNALVSALEKDGRFTKLRSPSGETQFIFTGSEDTKSVLETIAAQNPDVQKAKEQALERHEKQIQEQNAEASRKFFASLERQQQDAQKLAEAQTALRDAFKE